MAGGGAVRRVGCGEMEKSPSLLRRPGLYVEDFSRGFENIYK